MRNISRIACSLFLLLSVAPEVYAHTLKIDRNIGVNLHIDPDDAPVAGRESKLLLDIQDKSKRFNPDNPANCECILTISQNGTALKSLPVVVGGSYAQLRFTFPHEGAYSVIVEGKPRGGGVPFQSFRAEFEYFVRSEAPAGDVFLTENALIRFTPYVALGVGLVIIAMFVLS